MSIDFFIRCFRWRHCSQFQHSICRKSTIYCIDTSHKTIRKITLILPWNVRVCVCIFVCLTFYFGTKFHCISSHYKFIYSTIACALSSTNQSISFANSHSYRASHDSATSNKYTLRFKTKALFIIIITVMVVRLFHSIRIIHTAHGPYNSVHSLVATLLCLPYTCLTRDKGDWERV